MNIASHRLNNINILKNKKVAVYVSSKIKTPRRKECLVLVTHIQARRESHDNCHGTPDGYLVRQHTPMHLRETVQLENRNAVRRLRELTHPTKFSGISHAAAREEENQVKGDGNDSDGSREGSKMLEFASYISEHGSRQHSRQAVMSFKELSIGSVRNKNKEGSEKIISFMHAQL
jgi:hypothetical protein